jgi:predicted  nucleic acid-binding Zn-ribbon protein
MSNIQNEFSKIKLGFVKVKNDMNYLAEKIHNNYEDFKAHHSRLSEEIKELSINARKNIEILKLKENSEDSNKIKENKDEINNIKLELKELKNEVHKTREEHKKIENLLSNIKNPSSQNSKGIKDLKEKLKSSELEIYLLKEKMNEQDEQLKNIKDINKHLFNIIEELTNAEIHLINSKEKK